MDKKQLSDKLKNDLNKFKLECQKYNSNMQITDICVNEAFYGVADSSFDVEVYAPYLNERNYATLISKFYDILWQTTTPATRRNIHTFCIIDGDRQPRCATIN